MSLKVFLYHPTLDCFTVTSQFQEVVEELGLAEWTPVVWLGRILARSQDFGEHWFDNWDEREALEEKAKELGLDSNDLLVVVPERFIEHDPSCLTCSSKGDPVTFRKLSCPTCGKDVYVGADGPCHSPQVLKEFWTDVLNGLHLSLSTLFSLARENNAKAIPRYRIDNLEDRIKKIAESQP